MYAIYSHFAHPRVYRTCWLVCDSHTTCNRMFSTRQSKWASNTKIILPQSKTRIITLHLLLAKNLSSLYAQEVDNFGRYLYVCHPQLKKCRNDVFASARDATQKSLLLNEQDEVNFAYLCADFPFIYSIWNRSRKKHPGVHHLPFLNESNASEMGRGRWYSVNCVQ